MRVEVHRVGPGVGTADVDRQPHRTVLGELVEQVGDVARDAGPHQDDVDPGEHRPVGGGRGGHLHLLEEVDADRAVVTVLREPYLDEVGDHRELLRGLVLTEREPRDGGVGGAVRAAVGPEVPLEHSRSDRGDGERGEGAPDAAVAVAVLQAAGDHEVERRAGDHPEVAGAGDLGREAPRGDPDAHAAEDDGGPGEDGGSGRAGRDGGGCHASTLSFPTVA
ncbi:hypothetical protein [Cellulomonas sp. P24]|uniref:hypothetical protein n=1 Tax=Cellulomonas sp. P24 TaxID=2885206 RepID=UPI00216B5642|nr:hypothetical protein [Cellulomonas sp. P24]MCR6494332.1 hypothetical protein [Cellulomonas sp. P24]